MSTSQDASEGKDALYAFVAQAATGQLMWLYHTNQHFSSEASHLVTFALCTYLNKCWMNLMRDDDAFVVQSLRDTGHSSPVCLIHKIRVVVDSIAQEMLREIRSFVCAARGDTNMLRFCLIKAAMYTITSSAEIKDALKGHECNGKSLEQERQEWIEAGRKEVEFFKVVVRKVDEKEQ